MYKLLITIFFLFVISLTKGQNIVEIYLDDSLFLNSSYLHDTLPTNYPDGIWVVYDVLRKDIKKNKRIIYKGEYHNHLKTGVFEKFSYWSYHNKKNKKKMSYRMETYLNGQKNGITKGVSYIYKHHQSYGFVYDTESYKNGKLDGVQVYITSDNYLSEIEYYEDGLLIYGKLSFNDIPKFETRVISQKDFQYECTYYLFGNKIEKVTYFFNKKVFEKYVAYDKYNNVVIEGKLNLPADGFSPTIYSPIFYKSEKELMNPEQIFRPPARKHSETE